MENAIEIIKKLHRYGHEGYLVGGCVRDMVIGKESKDIDISTSANPHIIQKIFSDFRVVPTGIEYGTLSLIINDSTYEITTFRKDVATDGRRATIEYANTIKEDLARRDFTMNAIAYNPITKEIIDPFGGVKDIELGLIQCVGNPIDRFKEDYLRMIRALRFKSILNFRLDEKTANAIVELSDSNWEKHVSVERIKAEIDNCFSRSDNPSKMINYLYATNLLQVIFPELEKCVGFKQNKYHKYDVFNHTMKALDAVPKEFPLIRWAVLFHDLGKVETCEHYGTPEASFHNHEFSSERIAGNIMNTYKFSNADKDYICKLVRNHMFSYNSKMKDSAIRRLIIKVGEENLEALCILKFADRVGNGTKNVNKEDLDVESTNLMKRYNVLKSKKSIFKINNLAINGNDIMKEFNLSPGPLIGKALKECFEAVVENPSFNKESKLMKAVNNFLLRENKIEPWDYVKKRIKFLLIK